MEYQPPPFFNRGPAPLVRLLFFVVLAALLMVIDARFRYAETLRAGLALFAYPMQRLALVPGDLAEKVADFFTSQSQLQSENDALRGKHLQTAKDLITLPALTAENVQLRSLLDARQRLPRQTIFAEILYAGRDPFSRKVIIDKGGKDGIQPGLPVVDDIGVIGQVTRSYPLVAEVTLITDKDHAIPVQVVRNGLRAVAYGAGDGATLDLRFMAANADIQNGDTLVTSGIDGTYPPGIPVARVARIERDAAYTFAKITCAPTAGTNQHKQVLVLGQEANLPPAPPQVQEPETRPTKAKRPRKRE
jgi:rod shape-determining protein MreC